MLATATILSELQDKFGVESITPQPTRDEIPTFWTPREKIHEVIRHLKTQVADPYKMLYDITAIDERVRTPRDGEPPSDFTVVYHLFCYARNEYIRIKVPLQSDALRLPTITDVWPSANWYEREVWICLASFLTATRTLP